MSPRLIATNIIKRVVEEKVNLTIAITNDAAFEQAGKDKPLIQEFCYGTLRWYIQLEYLMGLLLNKEIRKKDRAIKYLLLIGLYQMLYMRIPVHAVVSETVETCRELNKEWAKGLVNAVLRRFQRESNSLRIELKSRSNINSSHPEWLINRLQLDWPEHWQNIIGANNERPPMYLRVNQQKITRKDYIKLLDNEAIKYTETLYSSQGILLEQAIDVDRLPGFTSGLVSVQELAAQFSAELLELKPGQNVLDACAAPGGKSAHILETEPNIAKLTLVEKDRVRAKRLEETLSRLKLTAHIIIDDVLNIGNWWDGQLFDRILLDAPCSATGVIRRHPDIKLLRTPEEVDQVNTLQHELLRVLWQLLQPGGMLVYATCSILKQENSDTIKQFKENHNDCVVKPINTSWGVDTGYGKQILTGQGNMDGFFYSCIEKI